MITIDRLGGQGDGIAVVEGRTVYVAYGVPGDRLRVRLGKARGQGLTAAILAVEQAGPARREPPCAHFGRCGGCALQHVDDGLYAGWKRGRVVEALAAAGPGRGAGRRRWSGPRPAAGGGSPWRRGRGRAAPLLGFHAHESHDIVDLRECHVMLPALAALIAPLRAMLGRELRAGAKAEVTATATGTGIDLLIRADHQPGRDSRAALAAFRRSTEAGAPFLAGRQGRAWSRSPSSARLR